MGYADQVKYNFPLATRDDDDLAERNAAILRGERPSGDNLNSEELAEAKKAGAVKSADETLSWGRAGEVESTIERNDVPQPNAPSGISGSETHVATEPSTLGATLKPDTNHDRSWNMADIADYRIG